MSRTARYLIGLLLLLGSALAYADSRPSVVFLAPSESRFWHMVSEFMAEVSEDLDMDLEVLVDKRRHRFSYLRMVEELLGRDEKPDYLLFVCRKNITTKMLTLASDMGIKVFTFNTDVPQETRASVGMPREMLSNWIGHLTPDDLDAGRALFEILDLHAEQLELNGPGQWLPVVALAGTLDSSSGRDRNQGLLDAVASSESRLLQLVYGRWIEQLAQEKTEVLLKRYPHAAAIWTASDTMALGAIAAARHVGRQPGKDIVIGGIDWNPRALEAIRDGSLAVSMGRHFMGGGLVLLLLHDYHHGFDFAEGPSPASLSYLMKPATRDNVDRIERIMEAGNWRDVDFRRFSRALNPDLRKQDISADALMDQFMSAIADDRGEGQEVGNP